MCLQVGRMGPVSDDGPRQNNSDRSEGPWGRAAVAARTAVLKRATFLRHSTGNSTVEAESTKDGRKPSAATNSRTDGKALSEMLALKPERGKPAFRNFREGDGNGGIIRSPLRAIALPDYRKGESESILASLQRRKHHRTSEVGAWLRKAMLGYYQYHAVPGNSTQLRIFQRRVAWLWRSILVRRSQRAQVRWDRLSPLLARWLPQPRILHPYPDARFAATHPG